MKAVVQRVTSSSVTVEGEVIGKIQKGFNILLGVEENDEKEDAEILASKIAKLRVFEDDEGKMNLSLTDVNGSALVVSQFTLCADIKKGNRPSFTPAAKPDKAVPLYEYFMQQLKLNGISQVEHGSFGADMAVDIANDGPVTIIMDTAIWRKSK